MIITLSIVGYALVAMLVVFVIAYFDLIRDDDNTVMIVLSWPLSVPVITVAFICVLIFAGVMGSFEYIITKSRKLAIHRAKAKHKKSLVEFMQEDDE